MAKLDTDKRRTSWGNKAGTAACIALAAWMAAYWFQTAYDVKNQYMGFPLADYWQSAENLPRYENFDLSVFGQQHNEHRVVFPEIVFIADDFLFGAHEVLPIFLSALFQLATFGILAWALWRDRAISAELRIATILTGGVLMGWPGIAYVLSFPYLVNWTIVQIAVAAALLMLARGWVAAPVVCGVIATFSSGHGMLIWPVLLLVAPLLRMGWRKFGWLAVAAAAAIALYFYRLIPSADVDKLQSLREPGWFFGFLASMLSMPFSADQRILGLWLGPVAFLVFLIVFYAAWRRRLLAETPAVILFGVLIFSLLTVLVCGMGRTLPTYWDYPTAKVPRYLSVNICSWTALILAAVWVTARTLSRARFAWLALGVATAGMAYQLPRLNPWLARQFDFFVRQQNAVIAMESGVTCESIMSSDLFPDPKKVLEWSSILKKRHLSIYSGDRFHWVGRPLAELLSIDQARRPEGGVTTLIPFACAAQLAGWVQGGASDLLLVSENGVIAGLGRRLPAGLPLYLPRNWTAQQPRENWTGFVNYAFAGKTVQPFAVLADGRSAAPVGSAILVPPEDQRKF